MKNVILSTLIMVFVLVSCNQKNKQAETSATATTETTSQLYACSMHPEVTGKKGEKCSKCGMELTELITKKEDNSVTEATSGTVSFSLTEIQSSYSSLKNALIKNDSKAASDAGKKLYSIFIKINLKSIDPKLQKEYLEIVDSAKENAEHIGDNEGKLDHQKEHFEILTKDINDLERLMESTKK
jgi:hypothetical protein